MILADTDVLIDALHGKEPARGRIELELQAPSFGTTAISAFELRSGARTARQRKKVDALLAALTILPFDEPASQKASEIRLALEASGQKIGMADSLIAGICLSRSAALLTRNRAHFERVRGLALAALEL